MSKNDQREINNYFSTRGILYQPGFVRVVGSVSAAILLGQLLYWHNTGSRKDGWIYKTCEQMALETGLSRTQQDNAIKKLKGLGLLQTKRAGPFAKRCFLLDLVIVRNLLTKLRETGNLDCLKPSRETADNQQTITETTQKTTSSKSVLGALNLVPKEIANEFDCFLDVLKAAHKPVTARGIELNLAKLEELYPNDFTKQRACLEQSIAHGWQGLFPLNDEPAEGVIF